MPEVKSFKLMLSGVISALMSVAPGFFQETTAKESSQAIDLRPQGQPSDAAVKAIMEKWRITRAQQDEVQQTVQFQSFEPQFIQSTR